MSSSYTTLTPRLVVRSATEALETYEQVLGAVPGMVIRAPGGSVVHAEMTVAGLQMSLTESDGSDHARDPRHLGGTPVILNLMADDPDAVAARAVDHGWRVIFPIEDRDYGMRDGRLEDPMGHQWIVTKVREHLSAEELQARMDGGPAR